MKQYYQSPECSCVNLSLSSALLAESDGIFEDYGRNNQIDFGSIDLDDEFE